MGKSEDLMKGIDRVGIFERMKDYEDMAFETRAIDVGNDDLCFRHRRYLSETWGSFKRCYFYMHRIFRRYELLPGDRQRCISNDTADAGFIEKG